MIVLYVHVVYSFNCSQDELEQVLKLQYFLTYVSVANEDIIV